MVYEELGGGHGVLDVADEVDCVLVGADVPELWTTKISILSKA
jgi:hypothetical protein